MSEILVIDDNEDDRLLYRRVLTRNSADFSLIEVEDGDQGLARIEENRPACVLLDYSLPGHNGIEVLKRIRVRHPYLPVIMLTGQGNETVAVAAIKEGAQNYINKSAISPEAIRHIIRGAIEHSALQQRLQDQQESLQIFSNALAHDLKEPIRSVRTFLDLIRARETFTERGLTYFDYIQSSADRMIALIDAVHLYTRLGSAIEDTSRTQCAMNNIMHDVRQSLTVLIGERKATITSEPLPEVFANPVQMHQLLQNLLSNALRHGGETPVIHVQAIEKMRHWQFSVADQGPGIAALYRDKIFDPFKRMSANKEQGLGLGLAIAKRIVEFHGGKIWYEPNPEGGAVFSFTLPKEPTAMQSGGVTITNAGGKNMGDDDSDNNIATILLVEDNPADVELTKIMLFEEGNLHCHLQLASNGQEALNMLELAQQTGAPLPSLVLLDINMPGLNGFDVLDRVVKNPNLKHIPIAMCTTSTYHKDMERAMQLGAFSYITKTVNMGKLKPIIEKIPSLRLQPEGDKLVLRKVN